jgi:hypothetical protein
VSAAQTTFWDTPARVAAFVHIVLTLAITAHPEWFATAPAVHAPLLIVVCSLFILRPLWRAGLLRKSVGEIHRSQPGKALPQTLPDRFLFGLCLVIGIVCELIRWFGR